LPRRSFDKIAFFYDFVETYILKDYQGSVELITNILPQEERSLIIDIGGGTGFFSELFSNDDVKAIVVDLSRNMLKKVNKNFPVLADAASLGIKNEQFDLAIIINVLHHVPPKSQKKILSEVYRILKKGGQVFIIEVIFPNTLLNILFARFESFFVGKTYHLAPEKLKDQLDFEGFSNIEIIYPKKHSWKYIVFSIK
jgi:ubiquinone/menaquinone biosynthesis C-methylase UbiE